MTWIDTLLKVLGIVTPLAVAVLGAQLWNISSQRRKANAEAGNNEASSAATLSTAAVALITPYTEEMAKLRLSYLTQGEEVLALRGQVGTLTEKVGVLEDFADAQVDWELIVVEKCRDNGGPDLPPAPARPQF